MNLDPFLYWIFERESIRVKKERGDPPPWTSDQILANFRFCNVAREQDKVTIWIREHIREPYADHPHLWFMLCISRWVNRPETLAEMMAEGAWPDRAGFRPERMTEVLTARGARGDAVWTGVYIIRGAFGMPKAKSVSEITLGAVWEARQALAPIMKTSLQAAHQALSSFNYWGPFMSTQAIVDMVFCPALLANAPDREDWIQAGPGTLRGLNYLHDRPWNKPLSQERALEEMRELYTLLKAKTNVPFHWTDVPNILCEGSKMIKLQRGEGHVRATYRAVGR